VVDLHFHHPAAINARMHEDRQRAQRARQRPHATRSHAGSTFWPELWQRLSPSRGGHRNDRLRRAA